MTSSERRAMTVPLDDLFAERVQFGAGQPLLVVSGAQGEILVPLIDTICRRIDPAAKRITVELPEGLVDVNVVRGGRQDR